MFLLRCFSPTSQSPLSQRLEAPASKAGSQSWVEKSKVSSDKSNMSKSQKCCWRWSFCWFGMVAFFFWKQTWNTPATTILPGVKKHFEGFFLVSSLSRYFFCLNYPTCQNRCFPNGVAHFFLAHSEDYHHVNSPEPAGFIWFYRIHASQKLAWNLKFQCLVHL